MIIANAVQGLQTVAAAGGTIAVWLCAVRNMGSERGMCFTIGL
jgi:hypothetical protein